jgi:hypothetical protein
LLAGLRALLAGSEALHPGVERQLAPAPQQALADVVLAAELGDRALAAPSFCCGVNFRYLRVSLNGFSLMR